MLECLGVYHKKGVFQFESDNLLNSKVIGVVGEDFFKFLESWVSNNNAIWNEKKVFVNDFKTASPTNSDTSSNELTRKIKKYCELKGFEYKEKNSGGKLKFMVSLPKSTTDDDVIIDYIDTVDENTGEVTTVEVRRNSNSNVVNN